jgi:hypothetical protein
MNFDLFKIKFVHLSWEKGISRCMFGHSFAHISLFQKKCSVDELFCCYLLIHTGHGLTVFPASLLCYSDGRSIEMLGMEQLWTSTGI